MNFSDLLNLDYGYGWEPDWNYVGDLPYGDYTNPDITNLIQQSSLSLAGSEPTVEQILGDVGSTTPTFNRNVPLTLGGTDFNGDPMRQILAAPNADGTWGFEGRVNPDGSIDNRGFARTENVFGGPAGPGAAGSAAQRLRDALGNLARSGGSGGGGGTPLGISMPQISSRVADTIPAVPAAPMQTGAIPAAPPVPNDFRPLVSNVPLAQAPPAEDFGLRRLLRGER